jgi:hypothetical protein
VKIPINCQPLTLTTKQASRRLFLQIPEDVENCLGEKQTKLVYLCGKTALSAFIDKHVIQVIR